MAGFTYKDIYMEEGRRVLEVNILPEKCCNFDCIFCPIGRSENKIDTQTSFEGSEDALKELEHRIDSTRADLVFINSKGEAFVNDRLEDVIDLIKGRGLPVRLLSNGYVLGREEYKRIANKCDEIIGEIKVATEADFQKIQRPIEGYTLEEHISSMASFNHQYHGMFILEVTLLKGYNDTTAGIDFMRSVIRRIAPDRILIERMNDEPFRKKLGIADEEFLEISEALRRA